MGANIDGRLIFAVGRDADAGGISADAWILKFTVEDASGSPVDGMTHSVTVTLR